MSDQNKLPPLVGKSHAALLEIAEAEGVAVAEGAKYKDVQAAIIAHRKVDQVVVRTGESSGGIASAAADSEPTTAPAPVSAPSPPPAKEKTPTYWVTAGNIAHGTDGLRRLAGEPIKLDSDDAAALLKAKVITKDRPDAHGDDQ